MSDLKIVIVYTGNRGFRQYKHTDKIIRKPAEGFKDMLREALKQ